MDLAETMKSALSKVSSCSGSSSGVGSINSNLSHGGSGGSNSGGGGGGGGISGAQQNDLSHNSPGIGYVTEKLYMLLQLYIQNKGWNPSVEILQCFSELKDNALLPSAAYLQ